MRQFSEIIFVATFIQVLLVNVRDSLLETFNELIAFKSNPSDSELDRFDEALVAIRSRHADLVSTVAEAVMEAKFEQEEMNRGADSGRVGNWILRYRGSIIVKWVLLLLNWKINLS